MKRRSVKRKPPVIKDDPRVKELAECVWFSIRSFRDRPIFNNDTHAMESWHSWFRRALEDAGFTIPESSPPKPEEKS